jgi:uncharacterized protein YbjT (DUF2867 family)
MITVLGATGHTGKRAAEQLLKAGERVRALGRSAEKLAELERAGAETRAGDAGDAAFLTAAFRGADAVYVLLPSDVQAADYRAKQDRDSEAITAAVRDSGVRHVVLLSSLGAEQPAGTGPIAGLHALEERLRRVEGAHVLALRPGFFFENFFLSLGLVKHRGILGDAVGPDVVLPMIATRDIADVAARALAARDWQGFVVRELLGPRDLTHAEVARILGERIGRPDLAYVQVPYRDAIAALEQAGTSPSFARTYAEMAQAFNEGRVKPRAGRSPEATTPTRLEDFASELARAFQAM